MTRTANPTACECDSCHTAAILIGTGPTAQSSF